MTHLQINETVIGNRASFHSKPQWFSCVIIIFLIRITLIWQYLLQILLKTIYFVLTYVATAAKIVEPRRQKTDKQAADSKQCWNSLWKGGLSILLVFFNFFAMIPHFSFFSASMTTICHVCFFPLRYPDIYAHINTRKTVWFAAFKRAWSICQIVSWIQRGLDK